MLEKIVNDPLFSNKMILLSGPRQVGKTTLAKKWITISKKGGAYYNWDSEQVRRLFRKDAHFFESALREKGKNARLVFDEIHKITSWKNLLKGYYDTFGREYQIIVTGSARLEYFHTSGDSMLGRYHLTHLLPLTPFEALKKNATPHLINCSYKDILDSLEQAPLPQDVLDALLQYTGFPEIFIKQDKRVLNLWHREYFQRTIREDLRDLSRITDLIRVEHLYELLPQKTASPLSLNSLREDLNCSYDAVKTIIEALIKLYSIILIKPYSKKIQNALKKEPKCYFFDWTIPTDKGAQFENMVAITLQNYCNLITDYGWHEMRLFYLRDKQKREVDFLITKDNQPFFMVETKYSTDKTHNHLEYFSQRLDNIPGFMVSFEPGLFKRQSNNIWQVSFNRFMNLLFQNT